MLLNYILIILFTFALIITIFKKIDILSRIYTVFYQKKLKSKQELNEFEKLFVVNFCAVKKLNIKILKNIMRLKNKNICLSYKLLQSSLKLKEEVNLKICNVISGNSFHTLIYYDKIIVKNKGRIFYGKVEYLGNIKHIKHSYNKTEYHFENDNKIFTGSFHIVKNCLKYSGYGKIIGTLKMIKREDGFSFDFSGEVENVFMNIPQYILQKEAFLEHFNRISAEILYGDEFDFESINLNKIVNIPLKNHFDIKYKIINDNFLCPITTAKICDIFAVFGFNIIFNYIGKEKFLFKSKLITIVQSENPLEICHKINKNINLKNYKNYIVFKNSGIENSVNNLSRLFFMQMCNIENITDTFTLMVLSLSADKEDCEKLLFKAIKSQLIDGKLINFTNSKYGVLDKNDYFTLLFPVFLCKFGEKYGFSDFLEKRFKYAMLKDIKKDTSMIFGLIERIYPTDLIYEHTLKCFEICDFKDDFIAVNNLSHIGGFFKGNYKYKNLIFTLTYLLGINNFSAMLTESDYCKFITFSKSLCLKIKNILSSRETVNIAKDEKLIIYALAEGVFKDKQFSSSYEFKDFYDFFDYFAINKGKIKEIEVISAIFLIVGNLFQDNISLAYVYAGELLNLMTSNGEIYLRQKLCFDGDCFYFDGDADINLSLLFYSLLKNYLLAIKCEGGNLILGKIADKFDGEKAEININGTNLKIQFKKSGKNKITIGDISYINVKSYPLNNVTDAECIIEF